MFGRVEFGKGDLQIRHCDAPKPAKRVIGKHSHARRRRNSRPFRRQGGSSPPANGRVLKPDKRFALFAIETCLPLGPLECKNGVQSAKAKELKSADSGSAGTASFLITLTLHSGSGALKFAVGGRIL